MRTEQLHNGRDGSEPKHVAPALGHVGEGGVDEVGDELAAGDEEVVDGDEAASRGGRGDLGHEHGHNVRGHAWGRDDKERLTNFSQRHITGERGGGLLEINTGRAKSKGVVLKEKDMRRGANDTVKVDRKTIFIKGRSGREHTNAQADDKSTSNEHLNVEGEAEQHGAESEEDRGHRRGRSTTEAIAGPACQESTDDSA